MRRCLLLAVLAVGLGCSQDDDDEVVASVDVTAVENRFEPDRIEVPEGRVEFHLVNDGRKFHTFVIGGIGFKFQLDSGEEKSAIASLDDPGEVIFYCDVEGHREDGMEGVLVVTAQEERSAPADR